MNILCIYHIYTLYSLYNIQWPPTAWPPAAHFNPFTVHDGTRVVQPPHPGVGRLGSRDLGSLVAGPLKGLKGLQGLKGYYAYYA